jgi:retron-type reverse transcriptase
MRSKKKRERNIRKIEKYEMRKKLKIYDIFGTPQRGLPPGAKV